MPSSMPSVLQTDYFVNCGGGNYFDGVNQWVADMIGSERLYHDTGNAYTLTTGTVEGTPHQALYRTERNRPMKWTFPVPPGDYVVSLHFAEIWDGAWATGVRVFDVKIEDIMVLDDFDIFDVAGKSAWVETFETTVSDNMLTIEFVKVEQNPKASLPPHNAFTVCFIG
jgi:hypothetical protein